MSIPPFSSNPIATLNSRGSVRQTVYNVKDYGALGDGVTDDSGAVQAALNAINGAGGGILFLPSGNYLVSSSTLIVYSNTLISGTGNSSKITLAQGRTIFINGVSNVWVENIATDSGAHDLSINNFAINIVNSSDIHIDRCNILNCGSFGVFINATGNSATSRVWVTNSYLVGNGNSDVIGGGPANSTGAAVQDLFLINNDLVQQANLGALYDNAIAIVKSYRLSILNNRVAGNLGFAVEQNPNMFSTIQGNILKNAPGKSFCYLTVDITNGSTTNALALGLSNNVLENGGIRVNGVSTGVTVNCAISDNILRFAPPVGIAMTYINLSSVIGNIVHGATTAIGMTNANNNNVSGNILLNSTTGILESASANNTYFGNTYSSVTTPTSGLAPTSSVLSSSGGNIGVGTSSPTAGVDSPASTTTNSGFRIRSGTAPTSPNSGDVWFDGTHLQFRNGATTNQIDNQGGGTVTGASVVSANGLAGSVANPTTTPAITLSTTITGLLKGNGTAISAATSNTDYLPVANPTATGTLTTGNITLGTAGNKITITTGSNASAGTATLTGGTVTVSTTAVTANSLIFLTDASASLTNVGTLSVTSKSAGTSFTVTSANVLDTSTFNWLIIN